MASNGVTWSGLTELLDALQRLPDELKADARAIVERRATAAREAIVAAYPTYAERLRRSVQLRAMSAPGDASAIAFQVRNTAPDATWFEWGTEVRHTVISPPGANRGAMPAGRVLVPIAIRERAAMVDELRALVLATGATLGGDNGVGP